MTYRTIWSKGALNHIPPRYRNLVRIAYPAVYLINVVIYGVVGGATGGSRVLQQALPMPFSNVLLALDGFFALMAVVAIVLVNDEDTAQRIERAGVMGLVPLQMTYAVVTCLSFFTLGDPDDQVNSPHPPLPPGLNTPLSALVGISMMLVFSIMRTLDLSTEIGKRRRTRNGA